MSYEAEVSVIGSLLIDSGAIEQIPFLRADMFTDEILGEMFAEFEKGHRQGYPVDAIVLSDALGRSETPFNIIDGKISECAAKMPYSANLRAYGRIVYNDYRAMTFRTIINRVTGDAAVLDEEIDRTMSDLEAIRVVDTTRAKTLSQIAKEYQDKYFCELDVPRVDLGFRRLDEKLGGLEGGDLIIIGARPAVGKSAFASQIALNFAKCGKKVGYFNLEMQEKQVYERFLSSLSGVGVTRIRTARQYATDEERILVAEANKELSEQKNIVITTGSKRVSDIRAEGKTQAYDVIIVDYLQLVKPDRTYKGNRYAEVGAISHGIKALAMEMNIPIIGLCQLNRSSEGREDKEPTMGELRESGDFEQDASVILLLWNTSKDDRSKKCIKIEKNRQGQTEKFNLKFDGDRMQFVELGDPSKEFVEIPEDVEPVFE